MSFISLLSKISDASTRIPFPPRHQSIFDCRFRPASHPARRFRQRPAVPSAFRWAEAAGEPWRRCPAREPLGILGTRPARASDRNSGNHSCGKSASFPTPDRPMEPSKLKTCHSRLKSRRNFRGRELPRTSGRVKVKIVLPSLAETGRRLAAATRPAYSNPGRPVRCRSSATT